VSFRALVFAMESCLKGLMDGIPWGQRMLRVVGCCFSFSLD